MKLIQKITKSLKSLFGPSDLVIEIDKIMDEEIKKLEKKVNTVKLDEIKHIKPKLFPLKKMIALKRLKSCFIEMQTLDDYRIVTYITRSLDLKWNNKDTHMGNVFPHDPPNDFKFPYSVIIGRNNKTDDYVLSPVAKENYPEAIGKGFVFLPSVSQFIENFELLDNMKEFKKPKRIKLIDHGNNDPYGNL